MSRIWTETLSPMAVNEKLNCYHGFWMPQMDRCWDSDDGYQVCSRLIKTDWGKVEHVTIKRLGTLSSDGSADISWATKMEIKNELFGENRVAIEVFPKTKRLVDVMDIYHLWVFDKDFNMPFGIHPMDPTGWWIKRGVPKDLSRLMNNTKKVIEQREGAENA